MNFFWTAYVYDSAPILNVSQVDLIGIWSMFVLGAFIFFLLPYIREWQEERQKKQNKLEKKRMLEDLIVMKELQGEIEQEMREALIHSELRSKKEGESVS